MRAAIPITDRVSFDRPTAAPLVALFEEAELEFEALSGTVPRSREDWKVVIGHYHDKILTVPTAAALAIHTAPAPPRRPRAIAPPALAELREDLTPFGHHLAAEGWRVVSAAAAVEPMRQILARYGLQNLHATRPGGPSWYESPEIYIQWWTNSESAIVLEEDAQGPGTLRFLTRVADGIVTVMQIGQSTDAQGGSMMAATP